MPETLSRFIANHPRVSWIGGLSLLVVGAAANLWTVVSEVVPGLLRGVTDFVRPVMGDIRLPDLGLIWPILSWVMTVAGAVFLFQIWRVLRASPTSSFRVEGLGHVELAEDALGRVAKERDALRRAVDTLITWFYREDNAGPGLSDDALLTEPAPRSYGQDMYRKLGLEAEFKPLGSIGVRPTPPGHSRSRAPLPDRPAKADAPRTKPPTLVDQPVTDQPPVSPYSGEWAGSTEPPRGWGDNHWRGQPLRACEYCGWTTISGERLHDHQWTAHVTPPDGRLGGEIFEDRQPWTVQPIHFLGPTDKPGPRTRKGHALVGPTYWVTRNRAEIAVQTGQWDYGHGPDDQSSNAAISSQVQT